MDFADNKLTSFTKKIIDLIDQPNMQPDELKAYFDSSPEEVRQAHNSLCDALTTATTAATAAANLGFQSTAGVPADNVQDAIEDVQSQLTDAVLGNIPSGSVTNDKLAQDVRDHFTTIENAAASEASTRASADSSLQSQINTHTSQISSLTTAKCEVVFGSYTGNGDDSQYISLGFPPKALLCAQNNGTVINGNRIQGGIILPGTAGGVTIEGNGFRAKYSSDLYWTNVSGRTYYYIAIK